MHALKCSARQKKLLVLSGALQECLQSASVVSSLQWTAVTASPRCEESCMDQMSCSPVDAHRQSHQTSSFLQWSARCYSTGRFASQGHHSEHPMPRRCLQGNSLWQKPLTGGSETSGKLMSASAGLRSKHFSSNVVLAAEHQLQESTQGNVQSTETSQPAVQPSPASQLQVSSFCRPSPTLPSW